MNELSKEEIANVKAIAISVDPEFDTPEAAIQFLSKHKVQNLMLYLIGTPEELQPVWDNYSVLSAIDTGSSNSHSVPIRIFDRNGIWVSSLRNGEDLTPETLLNDIREALKK